MGVSRTDAHSTDDALLVFDDEEPTSVQAMPPVLLTPPAMPQPQAPRSHSHAHPVMANPRPTSAPVARASQTHLVQPARITQPYPQPGPAAPPPWAGQPDWNQQRGPWPAQPAPVGPGTRLLRLLPSKGMIVLHPATLFGIVAGTFSLGVLVTVLLLRPRLEPSPIIVPAAPARPAPTGVPMASPVAPAPAAPVHAVPAATVPAPAPARPVAPAPVAPAQAVQPRAALLPVPSTPPPAPTPAQRVRPASPPRRAPAITDPFDSDLAPAESAPAPKRRRAAAAPAAEADGAPAKSGKSAEKAFDPFEDDSQ